MLKLIKKSNQAGVTLLETILVLSLIAIIMVGGLNLYRNASNAAKTNEARRQIVALATGIRSLHMSKSTYGASNAVISSATLVATGAVPQDMAQTGDTTISNTFGDTVIVKSVDAAGGTGSHFEVFYPSVPSAVCYQIVTSDIGAAFLSLATGCAAESAACAFGVTGLTAGGAPGTHAASTFCGSASNDLMYTFQ